MPWMSRVMQPMLYRPPSPDPQLPLPRRDPTLPYPCGVDSVMLDALDFRLLHALQLDGRAPFSKIADVLGVSDRTVARRFGRLSATGTARVAGVANSYRTGHAEWLVRLRVRPSGTAA